MTLILIQGAEALTRRRLAEPCALYKQSDVSGWDPAADCGDRDWDVEL